MQAELAALVADLRSEPSRTGSLVFSLYGDAIAPRGGSVWLGTLFEILRPLGVADGVVRTAVSRLASEGWLERRRVGRNSFYRLAKPGDLAFEAATERIYGPDAPPWDGSFRLILVEHGPDRARLEAEGFSVFAPGVLISPREARAGGGLRLSAQAAPDDARALAVRVWPLADLDARYRRFVARFETLLDIGFDPLDALIARLLMIHEYRRVVLRDPRLPLSILPPDWPGAAARTLGATLYDALLPASEAWLDEHATMETGRLPAPDAAFAERFSTVMLQKNLHPTKIDIR